MKPLAPFFLESPVQEIFQVQEIEGEEEKKEEQEQKICKIFEDYLNCCLFVLYLFCLKGVDLVS